MWLFLRHFQDLDEKEQEELATIRRASETAQTLYQLVQGFLQMVRKLQGERFDAWRASVADSQIEELHRFANGLERDKAAVLMGLTHSHNNGQAEGQVTRIKLIKRMMYGRAGFPRLASTRFASVLAAREAKQAPFAQGNSSEPIPLALFWLRAPPARLNRVQGRLFLILQICDRVAEVTAEGDESSPRFC